jgi:hypothetical protein
MIPSCGIDPKIHCNDALFIALYINEALVDEIPLAYS